MPEPEKFDELTKLAAIATDMELVAKLRIQAIETLGDIKTHESLLVLLSLAANENLTVSERDLSLKRARDIVKSSR